MMLSLFLCTLAIGAFLGQLHGTSAAPLGVAAHECGHAIQHMAHATAVFHQANERHEKAARQSPQTGVAPLPSPKPVGQIAAGQ